LFERVGHFDESFTCVGLEDVELGMRLARTPGCVLRYEPLACARHYHDQSLRDYMRKVEAAGARNLGILASRYSAELGTGALGWLVSGPADGWAKMAVRALLSLPYIVHVMIPLAEIAPGHLLNRVLVKYLLASSMLRGYRRSLADRQIPAGDGTVSYPARWQGNDGMAVRPAPMAECRDDGRFT
jgi:hypothetical protein